MVQWPRRARQRRFGSGSASMRYHGILLDAAGTVRGFRRIDCDDDLAAVDAARDVLERSALADAIEVWRDRERVARISKPLIATGVF
jgi:hypothetical protein